MKYYYSSNQNVQLLVALLHAHNIRKIVASPGTTNLELMASLQQDSFFEMYSCVDERSAAYMACGLATESGEPVVITCTEATASRNYYSGLTEAYHRKLPILAVTGLHDYYMIDHLNPQVINRSVSPLDSMKLKVNLPVISCERDYKESELKINQAILELTRNGGGPVHINMPWGGGKFDFSIKDLPKVRVLRRYSYSDELPEISHGKVAVLVGGHSVWNDVQTKAIDEFCERYNAVVICDHTSKYYGKYRVQPTILAFQKITSEVLIDISTLIHIGEEYGDDTLVRKLGITGEVWRVSPDGEIRDTFGKLTKVFQMEEKDFFTFYANGREKVECTYFRKFVDECAKVSAEVPQLPFSSIYLASQLSTMLPKESIIHFGLSDSIRAWNFFSLPQGVQSRCNSGCRGIDGCVSGMIGAALSNPQRLFFGVFGDLTFFYDMNVLGNRYVGKNVRIVVINNDGGNIFRHNGHAAIKWFGYEETNKFIAAGGHFGKKSNDLLRHYSEDLGFEYFFANDKESLQTALTRFTTDEVTDKPMLLEVFTESRDDSNAFDMMANLVLDTKEKTKETLKHIIGEQGTAFIRKITK